MAIHQRQLPVRAGRTPRTAFHPCLDLESQTWQVSCHIWDVRRTGKPKTPGRQPRTGKFGADSAARAAPASRGSNKPTSHGLPLARHRPVLIARPAPPDSPCPRLPRALPSPLMSSPNTTLPSVDPSMSSAFILFNLLRFKFSSPPVRPRQPIRLHPHRMDLYPLHRSLLHNRTYVLNAEFPDPPAHIRF